jgi:hypothetical protein
MQPSSNATYRMTCRGPGGNITRTASVSVSANNTPSSPPPPTSGGALSVSLSASDTRIRSGQSVTISWSSKNATACIGAGHWGGSKPLSGSQVVRPTKTSYYVLGCSGTAGGISRVVQVIVN